MASPTTFRWAICATGKISQDFAHAIRQMPGHEVVAVGSRSAVSAINFVRRIGADPSKVRTYGSTVEMARDLTLACDATYIGLPPAFHADLVCELMANGRPTLCEKPIASRLEDVKRSVTSVMLVDRCYEAAAANRTLLMEGVWTRCFPATRAARDLLASGTIGNVIGVQAEFGYDIAKGAPDGIRGDPATGGMTRDIGIYLAEKALLAYPPSRFAVEAASASALRGLRDGVDLSVAASLHFARVDGEGGDDDQRKGGIASLLWTGLADTPETARFLGTAGSLFFDAIHHAPTTFVVRRNVSRTETVDDRQTFDLPLDDGRHKWNYPGSIALQYEAAAFQRARAAASIHVPEWTHADSLASHTILDTLLKASLPPP